MKKTIFLGVLMITAMLVSGVFAQDSDGMNSNSMKMKKNPDSKFMMKAAMGGKSEISLGETALQQSTNDDIKEYAQMLIDDHTAAGAELMQLAESKNVMLPTEMNSKHKKSITKLSSMSGGSFDKEFLKMVIKDHEKDIAMFKKEAAAGKDSEVKAFAAETLPTLEGHLAKAKSLMNEMMMMNKSMTEDEDMGTK